MAHKPTCSPYLLSVLALFVAISGLAQTRTEKQASAKFSDTAGTSPQSGNPLFLPAVTYPFGTSFSVQAADVNGDGKLDLMVAGFAAGNGTGSVGVLLNNGDGTFQPAVLYSTGPQIVTALAVADVNGDGRPDLIASGCPYLQSGAVCPAGAHGIVSVLLGNSDGTFQQAVAYTTGGAEASSVTVGDVNGDGKPDILITNTCQGGECGYDNEGLHGGVSVLLGNGDGTFQSAVVYDSGGYGARSIAAVDVNRDGKTDLLVVNVCTECRSAGSVDVLLGNGDGTFQPAVGYSSGGNPTSLAVADVNGDGVPDVLVVNACGCLQEDTMTVLLGNGDGSFQPAVAYGSGGTDPWWVAVGDVNGDGKPDVVVVNRCADPNCNTHSTIGVLLGIGDGSFEPVVTFDTGEKGSAWVTIADVNGDARPDLLIANYDAVSVLINNTGPGSPTTALLTASPNPSLLGQTVTLTAVVSSTSGTPTGTVIFYDRSTALGSSALVNGSSTLPVSSLGAGSHLISAAYQGSSAFRSSNSAELNQVVNTTRTTTTSLASSTNPEKVLKFVTYTATVATQSGGAATGTVTFKDGGATISTVALSGNQAAYRTNYPMAGSHPITATYSGDANNDGSTSTTVNEAIHGSTQTVVVTSWSPSIFNQLVTFTATVTSLYGTVPNGGLVTFKDGGRTLGSAALSGGTAAYPIQWLSPRTHYIKATYDGVATFLASTGKVRQEVVKQPTTTNLTSSPNPSNFGQIVTLTATVTSSGLLPNGTVTFKNGSTVLGNRNLKEGVAILTTSKLPVGANSLTATYIGGNLTAGSVSIAITQTVNQAPVGRAELDAKSVRLTTPE
jgi:hypothetical protein